MEHPDSELNFSAQPHSQQQLMGTPHGLDIFGTVHTPSPSYMRTPSSLRAQTPWSLGMAGNGSSSRLGSPVGGPVAYTNLQAELDDANRHNEILTVHLESMTNAFQAVVKAIPPLLHVANPLGQSIPTENSPDVQILTGAGIRELTEEERINLHFYTHAEWRDYQKNQLTYSTPAHPFNGSAYMETIEGQPVNADCATFIRGVAQRLWFHLLNEGQAPQSWGKATHRASQFFNTEMARLVPEMRYCENGWKITYLATKNYPSWHANRIKTQESTGSKRLHSDELSMEPGDQKRAKSTDSNEVEDKENDKLPPQSPSTSEKTTISEPLNLLATTGNSPDAQREGIHVTTTASTAASTAVTSSEDVPALRALIFSGTLFSETGSAPPPANIVNLHTDTSNGAGIAPASEDTNPSDMLPPPHSPIAEDIHQDDLNQGNSTSLPATTTQSGVAAKPRTARQLCKLEWETNNTHLKGKEVTAAFAVYWKGLKGTAEEARFIKAASETVSANATSLSPSTTSTVRRSQPKRKQTVD